MTSDVLLVACRDRQPRIECGGGLTARRTDLDTLHLVSAAATPLGGDAINLRVVVEAGARLRVRTAAATVNPPGSATLESHTFWTFEVADDPLGTPMAYISEFHCPEGEVATEDATLALAGGACLSTWQGERL